MFYKIFEIETKGKTEPDGYGYKTVGYHRLKSLQGAPYDMREEFTHLPEAYLEIEKFSQYLKHKTLTIIPIIDVDWEGKLREAWPR